MLLVCGSRGNGAVRSALLGQRVTAGDRRGPLPGHRAAARRQGIPRGVHDRAGGRPLRDTGLTDVIVVGAEIKGGSFRDSG